MSSSKHTAYVCLYLETWNQKVSHLESLCRCTVSCLRKGIMVILGHNGLARLLDSLLPHRNREQRLSYCNSFSLQYLDILDKHAVFSATTGGTHEASLGVLKPLMSDTVDGRSCADHRADDVSLKVGLGSVCIFLAAGFSNFAK